MGEKERKKDSMEGYDLYVWEKNREKDTLGMSFILDSVWNFRISF